MSNLATNPAISPSMSALSTATYMRVASISIAAYEYVASRLSPPLIVIHARSVIS
jgi:hypothetical protein